MNRLIVSPNVFIWTIGTDGLVYDSSSCTGFRFNNVGMVAQVTTKLNNVDNLYSVNISECDLLDDSICKQFINDLIVRKYAWIIVDGDKEPLSLKPILKIQDEKHYYIWLHNQKADGEVIDNLHNIIVNTGSNHGDDLLSCQTVYPVVSSTKLDVDAIIHFIEEAKQSKYLSEISIVGRPIDTRKLSRIQELAPIAFYMTIQDVLEEIIDVENLLASGNLTILVRLNTCKLNLVKDFIQKNPSIKYSFIVETEDDFDRMSELTSISSALDYKIFPTYNGCNKEFITPLISISEEELLSQGPDKREIFIHQSLNVFDFGKLYVLPNGEIRTNMIAQSHWSIFKDKPKDIVYIELTEGDFWLKTRDCQPCSQCVYQYLCPNYSNYEQLIGQTLCFNNPKSP